MNPADTSSNTAPHSANPHAAQPVLQAGAALESARGAMIMIHGRGSSAEDILSLAAEFATTDIAYLAPQAARGTWYPNRFNMPVEGNEPWLSWALARVQGLVTDVQERGMRTDQIVVLGFSQGACLALEWLARTGTRAGGVVGLSGGLIENGDRQREYSADLTGVRVFLGCSDVDFHIPLQRVERSAELLQAMGAEVTKQIYPNMGHTINRDEVEHVKELIATLAA